GRPHGGQRRACQGVRLAELELDRGSAAFQVAQVEQVVDERHQVLPGRLDLGDRVQRFLVQLTRESLAQEIRIPQDRRQWGAQLVRDVRQELRSEERRA